MKFVDLISVDGFSIKKLDIAEILDLEKILPSNRASVIDLNIASRGLVVTLEGQNMCQEKIAILDRYLGLLEGKKNQAWATAALELAKEKGHKTAKDKEWFALADADYIRVCNEISLTKAAKKFLEAKASYFSGWHYSFKTFISRDFSLEKLANMKNGDYNISVGDSSQQTTNDSTVFVDEEDIW